MLGLTSVTLSWTPAPNSTSQVIQYKYGAGTWENYITLDGTTNTWILTGLITNTIYSLRIVSYTLYCDPIAGTPDEIIDITCPTVTLDYDSGYVNYSFTHLDYDITGYTVDLLDLSDAVVDTIEEGTTSPVTGEFTSLTPGSYKLRVTVRAGDFERVCDSIDAILFGNVELSDPFTRNNCSPGFYGTTLDYVVPANTYYALTQIAADALAQADIDANGQAWVNINGLCVADASYVNVYTSSSFVRNDCPVNYSGTSVLYEVLAGTYTSLISQMDADAQATADIAANGQTYANANGSCVENTRYYNTLRTADYTRDDCSIGFYGSIVTYSVPAGTYYTYTSVSDANILADADLAANGQAYANANGTCTEDETIGNEERSQTFYKNDCFVGDECYQYTLYNTGGTILNYSYRPCNGDYAYGVLAVGDNITLCCEYVDVITIDFGTGHYIQGSGCSTAGSTGSGVVYTVPADTYFSYSLAAANAEADADIAANGQANANTLGTCDPGEWDYS